MGNHTGIIKEIKEINRNVYSVKILVSTLDEILPGQYVSIHCEGLTLRRPFSIADFNKNTLTILIKKRGKGTQFISSLKPDETIELSAPLGNNFKIANKKTLLIGAGIGVAPLIYLNKKFKEFNAETFFAAGFATKEDIINTPLDFISTDDGSNKHQGSICDYIEKLITEFKPERIITCAPQAVLKFIAKISEKHNIDCDVCMEKVMACGIGVCRGCVIKVKSGDKVVNKTICKDGPIFKGEEVVW